MARRINIDRQHPALYRSLSSVAAAVRTAAEDAGLTRSVMELVNVRVSQINNCAFCLDLHSRLAADVGVSAQRLQLLSAWREVGIYSPKERAALELAEAVTYVAGTHLGDADYRRARSTLSEDETSVLVWAAITINSFNRISIMSGHPVKER